MKLAGGIFAAVLVCALQGSAFGQAPPPPPPGGEPMGPEPTGGPQLRWSGGLLIALPQGDLDDVADTSLGVRADVGYNINANLSVHVALRYVFVNVDSDIEEFVDSISYYDIGAGGRYAFDLTGSTIRPFVDLNVLYSAVSVEFDGGDDSSEDPGVGFRVGAAYPWRPNMDIVFALGYTKIFVDEDDTGLEDAAWLELSGGIQGYF